MLILFGITALMMSSPEAADGPNMICALAETYYADGEHSKAISEINRCISEDGLGPDEKACAVLNRAKNYLALGADDKAAGDRDSALRDNPNLQEPETAAACLGSDETLAQELLDLAGS